MPVGISFENSSLKASFSLSSIPATETTPDKNGVKTRQFNSLTKNRVKATGVRRSWGSTASDHREEFWSVLQANYNYIMDNQLIDKCQEVDGDLSIDTGTWTLKEFYAQFSELYSWLNSVQETIYGKEENITDKALRAYCVNMVLEKSSCLKLFNDQASQLVQLYPEVQEEVGWRATHLNSKWDSILGILGPSDCDHCDQDICLDIDHELKCLRKWFKMMESCLQPLDFRAKYTKTEIETKALELNVLHRDIENHGKIVGSVVKLCKKTDARCNTVNARRIAKGLERRWHLLFLRSLEWQCYLESLSKRQSLRNSTSSSGESDSDCYKEPANKYPRLSDKEHNSRQEYFYSSSEDDSVAVTYESGMTENGYQGTEQLNGTDKVDGVFKFGEDTSEFTRSNRKAPNLATYYFKHEDTDSDMDRVDQFTMNKQDQQSNQSTLEETSEDEWTFTKVDSTKSSEQASANPNEVEEEIVQETYIVPKPKQVPEQIRKLVLKVEELVSSEKCRGLKRMSKVNQWLNLDKPDDSCDASGEDDEKESTVSEDFDASMSTLRGQGFDSQNASFSELNSPDVNNSTRTWGGSCMSNLNQSASSSPVVKNFSISESAIHKMNLSTKVLDRFTTVSSNNFNGNNSTSSTVEEISPLATEKSSPCRRKKIKQKKKCLFGKSDTHLLRLPYSPTNPKQRNLLIKSGSFSGYSSSRNHSFSERNISSDPPAGPQLYVPGAYAASTTSGADTDDDNSRRMPIFKSGCKPRHSTGSEVLDSSLNSPSLTTTEHSSLLSEQAWDNYQENYLSEPYSESRDSDAARRLLNFGEDYRNYIDSQSDCSAFSDMSPTFKRKSFNSPVQEKGDESDQDSIKQLIQDCGQQLNVSEDLYSRIKNGLLTVTNKIVDLVSTCDRHIALLNHMNESSDEYNLSKADKAITTGLLSQWRALKTKSVTMGEYRKLLKQIADLRVFFVAIQKSEQNQQFPEPITSENIQNEIEQCNNLLEAIKLQGSKLASLNVAVHRFTLESLDSIEYANCSLKSDISELYQLLDGALTFATEKLDQFENLLPAWKTLEMRLEQLQKDLSEDKNTINILDTVLSSGTFTDQTASCVRDVAKVLSETTSHQGYPLPELFTEGSFSDSGISDEGSEHEIGERQGRLAAIRRLVRQLEMGLAPESKARLLMKEKLDAAEEELKALQLRCRELIVRTAACSVAPERLSQDDATTSACGSKEASGEPDPDPPGPSSWIKRTFKASLAFQLVILTFVCLSCLFEPQCCDYMNNYSWSLSPKLHYDGRPPI